MANLNIPSSSQDHIHQTTTPQEIGVLQLDKELLFNAKELRETENYPRARFLNPEAETGKDLEQRNANAKDAFIKRFLEKFSGATLTFLNHPDFKITFDTITFDTNYNAYTVHFTSYMLHQRARFTMEKNTLHQEGAEDFDILDMLDQPSKDLLEAMFAYHSQSSEFQKYRTTTTQKSDTIVSN